jgi:uncharacterized iron-regulated membrane protein
MSATDISAPTILGAKLYRAVWRWHFYAGLYVIPFLLMLAITGGFMMIYAKVGNSLGQAPNVAVSGTAVPPSAQVKAALPEVDGGKFVTYINPEAADRPAFIEIVKGDDTFAVAVDPYTGKVLSSQNEAKTWCAFAEKIHGTLLIGTIGDRMIEIAASLTILMVATGLYLWWPKGEGFVSALLPRLGNSGRGFWRELHKSAGVWISLFLVLFVLSGLAWSGIWGDKYVKPWSTFPANKWDNVPQSDLIYASLNHGILHEVPWGLELAKLPASGSNAGRHAIPAPVALDSVVQWAAVNGFAGQYKIAVPGDEKGVYTISYDGRNEDAATPATDRYVYIDQYTGNILADVGLADYTLGGKVMAWGLALHKGLAGTVNFIFNLTYLSLVILMCVSGTIMWWKRRPAKALGAPMYARGTRIPTGVLIMGVIIAAAFPLGGAAIIAFAAVDFLLPKSWKQAGQAA